MVGYKEYTMPVSTVHEKTDSKITYYLSIIDGMRILQALIDQTGKNFPRTLTNSENVQ
jgi:hypothetical protein